MAALSSQNEGGGDDRNVNRFLERWKLDLGVVAWGLLQEVEGNVGRSHGEESVFAKTVKRKGEQLRVDMRRRGGGVGKGEIEEMWKMLRKIADETGV